MSKVNIQFYKPFGSSISLQDLPLELMSDFKKDLEMIRKLPEEKQKPYRTGHTLAGGLGENGEFYITPEVMFKWKKKYFDIVMKEYVRIHRPNKDIDKIVINSAWHNYMLKNQWNPAHHHLEFFSKKENPSLSCVGYISIPKDMKPLAGVKDHNNFTGAIEWFSGQEENLFQFGSYKRVPEERQFFLWNSGLLHMAYPHNSDEPRISFSFNAVIKFKTD